MLLILENNGIKNFMCNPTSQEIYKLMKLNQLSHKYKIQLNKNHKYYLKV